MFSITKERVSQEEFGRGQWHYSCQCGMFMALKYVRDYYWLEILHQNVFS